jgi:hypothetical protein
MAMTTHNTTSAGK